MSEDKVVGIRPPEEMAFKVYTTLDGQVMNQTIDIIDTLTQQVVNRLMRQSVDLQEKQTRQVLIDLGWTPPAGTEHEG